MRDIVLFGAYLMLGVTLPGLLLLRWLYGEARTVVEELALGVALGYVIEVIAYIAARSSGVPLLVIAWPITTYALFLMVPRLRRHWKRASRRDAPLWWSWSLAMIVVYLVCWSAFTFFRTNALTWPGLGTSHYEMPYHLALIGELRHHMPPSVPMVAGEPLLYHWFVYAHFAASSWLTGVEPLVLLFRLALLPMLSAFVVLVGMVAHRMTGSRVGALLAIIGTVFVAIPSLHPNVNGLLLWTGVQHTPFTGPTQTFGALLFVPVVMLLTDLLVKRSRSVGCWLLLGIFLIGVMGAKATYLPLLIAGLVSVAAVKVIGHRRVPWSTLAALAMTTACLSYAQFVLFGGAKQGMTLEPLSLMRRTWEEVTRAGSGEPPLYSLVGMAMVYLACWIVTWSGILGLLSRPRLLMQPAVALIAGISAAGFGGIMLLGHPGLSQGYFLQGVYPYLAILAAYGFAVIVRREQTPRWALVSMVAVGVLIAHLIRVLSGVELPLMSSQSDSFLYRPYIILLAVTLTAVIAAIVARRVRRVWALVITMIAAMGIPSAWHARILLLSDDNRAGNASQGVSSPTLAQVPQGSLAAGRWLRAHSQPNDLIATNAHCRLGYPSPCDSIHFWISALTERRVLVEGWAYTPTNHDRWRPGQSLLRLPFWDNERLQMNDQAINAPSAAVLQRLRQRYGVHWLFVERPRPSSRIGDFARLRFHEGDYAIYEIPGGH
ncbi:hypothetical protein ACTWPT_58575 [Nonomuraea sp. 3N208]|uniref:hypothetical protein n=1 Tax=Nonomuraea sp. 3N208 TaxID=3457421 RepID=UPI003FD66689